MADGTRLQCARVDRFPDRKGRDPVLPNVFEGSRQAACTSCRQRVWLSPAAIALVSAEGVKPICDVCQPATPVVIRDPDGKGSA